jgi:hypothetical protein
VGILTGTISGIVVVDVDQEHIPDELPLTACVKTSKGHHLYYKHPGHNVSNGVRVMENIDIENYNQLSGFVKADIYLAEPVIKECTPCAEKKRKMSYLKG